MFRKANKHVKKFKLWSDSGQSRSLGGPNLSFFFPMKIRWTPLIIYAFSKVRTINLLERKSPNPAEIYSPLIFHQNLRSYETDSFVLRPKIAEWRYTTCLALLVVVLHTADARCLPNAGVMLAQWVMFGTSILPTCYNDYAMTGPVVYNTVNLVIFACLNFHEFLILRLFTKFWIIEFQLFFSRAIMIKIFARFLNSRICLPREYYQIYRILSASKQTRDVDPMLA